MLQVHHQELKHDHRFACILTFGHNPVEPITSFSFAKLAFNRISYSFKLSFQLSPFFVRFFGRSAKRGTTQMNAVFFAELNVFVVAEQFVAGDKLGIHAETAVEVFNGFYQLYAFVKVALVGALW